MSYSAASVSNAQAILKEIYPDQKVQVMSFQHHPFLALCPKKENFEGEWYPQPVIYEDTQGGSATFSNSQNNSTQFASAKFLVTRNSDYANGFIKNELMLAAKSNLGAFVQGSKTVMDSTIRSCGRSLSSGLFRSGTGSIGQISAISTSGSGPYTTTITLPSYLDTAQFSVNMYIQASSSDGSGLSSDVLQITAVDRRAGTLTCTSAGSPTGTWAVNAYLVIQGNSNLKIAGLSAWIPAVTPTAGDNFFGVDRSKDPVRLAGMYKDYSSLPIEEALIAMSVDLDWNEGTPDLDLMNHSSYRALITSLGSKVEYVNLQHKDFPKLSFQGVELVGASGPIRVVPDRDCPRGLTYMLTMDTWVFRSLEKAPMILTYLDGLQGMRVGNDDASEVRVGYYGNLICNGPGKNGAALLAV